MSKKFRALTEVLENDSQAIREISPEEFEEIGGAAKELALDVCVWWDWGFKIHLGYPMFAE